MSEYFLDPAGQLLEIDYSHTYDFIDIDPDMYPDLPPWQSFLHVPNGNHGKLKATSVNCLVEAYPSRWNVNNVKWPTIYLYFGEGKLKEVIHENREELDRPKSYLDIPSY